MKNRIAFFESEMNGHYYRIKGLEADLTDNDYSSDDGWREDYLEYVTLVNQYNEYGELLDRNIEVYNYVIEHPYDVEGVRRYIYNSKVNEIEY